MSILSRSSGSLLVIKRVARLPKRWSGHNILEPHPSNFNWMKFKDMLHLYAMVGVIPLGLFTTIVNIRANPELAEIPEGYEPRHWEYFKHPITRFIARYAITPQDSEDETKLGILDRESELIILRRVTSRIAKVMNFYQDYRAYYFKSFTGAAEEIRKYREKSRWVNEVAGDGARSNLIYDKEVPFTLPTEGMAEGARDVERFK